MHRTLKYETALPAAKTPRGQQGRFDRWRKQFNQERPHEGIAMATPASLYAPSARLFPEKLERDDYPFDVERALVDRHGRAAGLDVDPAIIEVDDPVKALADREARSARILVVSATAASRPDGRSRVAKE